MRATRDESWETVEASRSIRRSQGKAKSRGGKTCRYADHQGIQLCFSAAPSVAWVGSFSCRPAPDSRWHRIYDGGVVAALMSAAVVKIKLVVAMMTAATDHLRKGC